MTIQHDEAVELLVARIIDPTSAAYIDRQDEADQPMLRKSWKAMETARNVLAALSATAAPAGEVERLRAALKRIAIGATSSNGRQRPLLAKYAQVIARAALSSGKGEG